MTKLLKYLMLLFAATLSFSLASCGGDDDDPDNPGGSSSSGYEVKSFTINNGAGFLPQFIPEGDYGALKFCEVQTYDNGSDELIGFYRDDYSNAQNLRMASCGKVSSLSKITSLSGVKWIDISASSSGYWVVDKTCFLLEENSGYILEGTYDGRAYYIRIHISNFNRNSAGKIIGINGSWQQFQPK